jgi:hypothetical protein
VATEQSARACQGLSELALALPNMVRSFLLLAAGDDKVQLERPTRAFAASTNQKALLSKDTKKALLKEKESLSFRHRSASSCYAPSLYRRRSTNQGRCALRVPDHTSCQRLQPEQGHERGNQIANNHGPKDLGPGTGLGK